MCLSKPPRTSIFYSLPKQMNICHVGDICPFDIGHRSVTAPGHPLLGRLADTDCSLKTFPPSLVYNFRPGQNYYRLQTLKIATTSRRLRPVDLIHDLTCRGRVVSYPQAQAQGLWVRQNKISVSQFIKIVNICMWLDLPLCSP